jgi:beta-galactosidase
MAAVAAGHWRWGQGRIAYGGDYNPEQWPEATWDEDARLMQEAGVNLATVGVFSWARLQPGPGRYDFAWLDRVLDVLYNHGVSVCLATGTASPPPWLTAAHPEILPEKADGTKLWPGGRQHYCPSSPAYRKQAVQLARAMAEHYAEHPALAIWHVGNEYGCHVPACYCDVSARAFRAWLAQRYGSTDALNDAWSTTFWSQRYGDFAEVLPPRQAAAFLNPGQVLDFARFSSDELLACFDAEASVLRELTPSVPVTTNFLGPLKGVDYWKWAPHEDFVSWDSYPDPASGDAASRAAMTYDLVRSLGHGAPWLLMEQAPSAVNWREVNAPKLPGQMRLWSYQAVARGADGTMFFQWRASRGGAEKWHSAMVPHAGPRSRIFTEVKQLGAELAKLGVVTGTTVPSDVAIVFDWENWWALEQPSHPSSVLNYMDLIEALYRHLWAGNTAVDFVRPTGDLSRYRLVVVPALYCATDEAVANLDGVVRRGAHMFTTFFSGVVDGNDRARLGGYLGAWQDLFGVRVEEPWPLATGKTVAAELVGPLAPTRDGPFTCSTWQEILQCEGSEALARYVDGPLAGTPLLARARHGTSGQAWYLASLPEDAVLGEILAHVLESAGVQPTLAGAPAGVEVVRRSRGDRQFLFACNHNAAPAELRVEEPGLELLSGKALDGPLHLPPFGVAVVQLG